MLKHSNPTIGYAQDLGYSIWVMNIATGRQDERSSIVVRGHGVLSPDGSRVVRCDEGLHLIDGESQLRIVDKGWGVAWSPDGTRFVYCREDGLYVTDGTHRERVAVVKASTTHWSPDGSMNAYCVWDKGLFVVKADGTAQRRLVSGYVGDANWAPDGSAVAYTVSCEGIFAVKLGGTVKRFTDHPGDGSPVWSPNGASIAYVRWYPGEVRVVNTDSTSFLLSRDQASDIAWAPDGTRVTYTSSGRYYMGGSLAVVDIESRTRTMVGGGASSVWIDNEHVAFLRWEGEVLYSTNDCGNRRHLFTHRKAHARLSPNGQHVAYIDLDTDPPCLVVADCYGNNPRVLTVGETSSPMWSTDSTRIGWVHPEGIVTVEVDGDHRLDFPMCTGWVGCCITSPVFSPHGTRLAYATREGVVIAEPNGQELLVIEADPLGSMAWSRDGTHLVCYNQDAATPVTVVNVGSGETFTVSIGGETPPVADSVAGRFTSSLLPNFIRFCRERICSYHCHYQHRGVTTWSFLGQHETIFSWTPSPPRT